MRRVVSTEFERKAMRSDDVLRDLEIVKLPKGEMKIVEISEPSEDSRSVIVTDDSETSSNSNWFATIRNSAGLSMTCWYASRKNEEGSLQCDVANDSGSGIWSSVFGNTSSLVWC